MDHYIMRIEIVLFLISLFLITNIQTKIFTQLTTMKPSIHQKYLLSGWRTKLGGRENQY